MCRIILKVTVQAQFGNEGNAVTILLIVSAFLLIWNNKGFFFSNEQDSAQDEYFPSQKRFAFPTPYELLPTSYSLLPARSAIDLI